MVVALSGLDGKGQAFLAGLKKQGFRFVERRAPVRFSAAAMTLDDGELDDTPS
jgi:hypothetical protein